jgi:hypothetical protein
MAVLPVWRSPMINSRWLDQWALWRHNGFYPVCNGSWTDAIIPVLWLQPYLAPYWVFLLDHRSATRASTTYPAVACSPGTESWFLLSGGLHRLLDAFHFAKTAIPTLSSSRFKTTPLWFHFLTLRHTQLPRCRLVQSCLRHFRTESSWSSTWLPKFLISALIILLTFFDANFSHESKILRNVGKRSLKSAGKTLTATSNLINNFFPANSNLTPPNRRVSLTSLKTETEAGFALATQPVHQAFPSAV